MRGSRFSDEQIIVILKEGEAGAWTEELCRRHGISPATFYAWKARFCGMGVSDARRLRQLEQENTKLKQLLAEATLDNRVLKDLLRKTPEACGATSSGGAGGGAVGAQRASCLQAHRDAAVGGSLSITARGAARAAGAAAHVGGGAAEVRLSAAARAVAPGGLCREP